MRVGAADLNVHAWRDKEGELMDGKHGYHYDKWVLGSPKHGLCQKKEA